jgi:hypothetical protein
MRDILDLDVERRGIEQIKPAPAQHALPSAWVGARLKTMHGNIQV